MRATGRLPASARQPNAAHEPPAQARGATTPHPPKEFHHQKKPYRAEHTPNAEAGPAYPSSHPNHFTATAQTPAFSGDINFLGDCQAASRLEEFLTNGDGTSGEPQCLTQGKDGLVGSPSAPGRSGSRSSAAGTGRRRPVRFCGRRTSSTCSV